MMDYKKLFLNSMALRSAIHASVAENKVYVPNITTKQKEMVRKEWIHALEVISNKYLSSKSQISRETFIEDVSQLQTDLNKNSEIEKCFCKLDEEGKIKPGSFGIRIAHCQKSLSLYLKYLWCYGWIDTPPVCPIDRVVLKLCEKYLRNNKGSVSDISLCTNAWTRLDDIEKYKKLLSITEKVAGEISPAEWELKKWYESVIGGTEQEHMKSPAPRKKKEKEVPPEIKKVYEDLCDKHPQYVFTLGGKCVNRDNFISTKIKYQEHEYTLFIGRNREYPLFCEILSNDNSVPPFPGCFENNNGGRNNRYHFTVYSEKDFDSAIKKMEEILGKV